MLARVKLDVLIILTCLLQVSCLMEWCDPQRAIPIDESERRRQLLTNAKTSSATTKEETSFGSTQIFARKGVIFPGSKSQNAYYETEVSKTSSENSAMSSSSHENMLTVKLANRVKAWPPWPFTLLGNKEEQKDEQDGAVTAANTYPSAGALFWAYFKQRTRIGIRQIQEIGSQLWFHLPPAAPPFILLASIPRKYIAESTEGGIELSRRVVPLISNPFARTLALSGVGISLMSWAHMEIHRKRNLTPLPLALPSQSVSRVFLPPFLPAAVPEPEIQALQSAEESVDEQTKDSMDNDETDDGNIMSLVSPKLLKQLNSLYESAPRPRSFQAVFEEWKRVRAARRREAAKIRRLSIFDELVALQAIKRKTARVRKSKSANITISNSDEKNLGYALVTGASQGIGRAIAVELARWEIPLVLVARDLDRLTSLAYDLEACYGVKCCVLKADLSEADAAERIYETTKKAGIAVDILVNNAGVAYEGLSVGMETCEVERMIMINTMSYAKLAKLYGKDMTKRGRGRMLMLSSMAGLTSSSPNTGLYGATKAFGKALAFSMAKELEPYGVGVTCLMPGPVVDTQFRNRSGTGRALCWYLPFYPRPAETVAHLGVVKLLDGATQAIPGWQNRVFAKLFRPILPQRVETLCVQAAWSPVRIPRFGFRRNHQHGNADEIEGKGEHKPTKELLEEDLSSPVGIHPDLKPRYKLQMPPRLLEFPEPESENKNVERSSETEGSGVGDTSEKGNASTREPSQGLESEGIPVDESKTQSDISSEETKKIEPTREGQKSPDEMEKSD